MRTNIIEIILENPNGTLFTTRVCRCGAASQAGRKPSRERGVGRSSRSSGTSRTRPRLSLDPSSAPHLGRTACALPFACRFGLLTFAVPHHEDKKALHSGANHVGVGFVSEPYAPRHGRPFARVRLCASVCSPPPPSLPRRECGRRGDGRQQGERCISVVTLWKVFRRPAPPRTRRASHPRQ